MYVSPCIGWFVPEVWFAVEWVGAVGVICVRVSIDHAVIVEEFVCILHKIQMLWFAKEYVPEML